MVQFALQAWHGLLAGERNVRCGREFKTTGKMPVRQVLQMYRYPRNARREGEFTTQLEQFRELRDRTSYNGSPKPPARLARRPVANFPIEYVYDELT